jgi:hypothetical protein
VPFHEIRNAILVIRRVFGRRTGGTNGTNGMGLFSREGLNSTDL